MADEGQTPRYSSASSGSNQVVQETNEASSTQDNASEDPQIRPGVTPEAQRPLFTTSACSSDTVQPGTSSAVILDESAVSDKAWTDMLNDWYEKTIGSPQIAPVPPGTPTLQCNAAHGHFRMPQYEVASLQPSASSGDDSIAPLESMVTRLEINEESFTLINGARNRGGTLNVQPVLEHGEALSHVSTYATATGSGGLQVPASSSGACHSVPSTSRGSIEEIMQGYDARIGTGSTQTGKREDISGVYSHVNHGTITSGERSHMCELCGNSFKRKDHLATHGRAHRGETPYHCSICGKSFVQKGNLDVHRRTHTGEKPYHCDICDKSFSAKSNLDVHIRTHTGEKPYHCDICDKSFSVKSNLDVHRRTHTGEKPFKCTTCTKSFTQQGHLRVHERTHRRERPYRCNMCEYSSTTLSDLKMHQRTHRNKKT